jgi:hypothetical protein
VGRERSEWRGGREEEAAAAERVESGNECFGSVWERKSADFRGRRRTMWW